MGIAPVPSSKTDLKNKYNQWVELGYHGGMRWLETQGETKYNPKAVLPECRSVILVGLGYYQEASDLSGEGAVARYAWGRDYHKVFSSRFKKILKKFHSLYSGEQFQSFADASPMDERFWVEELSESMRGKNTLLALHPWGSWFFIGEILTTLDLPPFSSIQGKEIPCPSGCQKCITACPTQALSPSGLLDARKCLSYLTIENDQIIPDHQKKPFRQWIFGCDICQEVCPRNLGASATTLRDFTQWIPGPRLSLKQILSIQSQEEFLKFFAGSPVMRAGLKQLQRNACLLAGNLLPPGLEKLILNFMDDENLALQDAARWALKQYETQEVKK